MFNCIYIKTLHILPGLLFFDCVKSPPAKVLVDLEESYGDKRIFENFNRNNLPYKK